MLILLTVVVLVLNIIFVFSHLQNLQKLKDKRDVISDIEEKKVYQGAITRQLIFLIIAALFVLAEVKLLSIASASPDGNTTQGAIFFLFVIVGLIVLQYDKGKKVDLIAYHNANYDLYPDNQKVILYLRAFNLDGESDTSDIFSSLRISSKEIDMASILIKFGRLIAVGKEGEKIPDVGFERRYFSNERWQPEVSQLIEKSRLIMLRPSTNEAILWEFGQIINSDARGKLIIWLDMGFASMGLSRKAMYNLFRKKVKELYDEDIPEYEHGYSFLMSTGKNIWEKSMAITQTELYKRLDSL